MKPIKIAGKRGTTTVHIGIAFPSVLKPLLAPKTVIVTDRTVATHVGRQLSHLKVIQIEPGESSKTLSTINRLYEQFLRMELDRSSLVVGIGGGVVCDITGFAASTYLRGLRFGFVPTTLLAQVDASIGGKNGVNLCGYKNLVGTISHPEFVLCDFSVLGSLPQNAIQNGITEIIKHAAIADSSLFGFLESQTRGLLNMDPAVLQRVVSDSIRIKSQKVCHDEMDFSERKKLNFGHTFGHALEKTVGLPHGEAVSIGMVMAAHLSRRFLGLPNPDVDRLRALIAQFNLPLEHKESALSLMDAIKKDKKRHNDTLDFVLLRRIGEAEIRPTRISELEEALDDMCQHC